MSEEDAVKPKILIVEDESIEAMSFEQWLKSYGFDVVGIARNAEDALKKITFLKPDLILMDIVLQGEVDGIDIANKIKESNIPIIYLTAHPEESTVKRAKLTTPYGYLTKPVNKMELKNTIELALYKNEIESDLRKSEERYRTIIENLQDAYIRTDQDGKVVMVSPSTAEMFRYESEKDMIGIPVLSLYKNPEDRDQLLHKLTEDIKVVDFQTEGLRKDGTTFWVSLNIQFYEDEYGKIQGTEGFIRDITSHKTSEDRIKRLLRLYTTLSQINQSVVRIKDKNELFKKICEVCVEYGEFKMAWIGLINHKTGEIRPVEYQGHNDGYLEKISININDTPSPHKTTTTAVHTGEVVINEDIKQIEETKWKEEALKRGYRSLASIPIKLKEQVIGILNIYASEPNFFNKEEINLAEEIGTDISYALNSIESEKILKDSEERFKAIIYNSNDIIRILDKNGKIIFDSPSSERILGYDEGFFIGKKPLDFIHPDDLNRVKKDLDEVYKDENPGNPTEFRIQKSDGTYIPVETIAQNLTDVPSIKGVVVTTHPLADRKMFEKALHKSERLLADIIDFLPDATFAIDHEGEVIAWNRAVEKMTGTTAEDIMGKGNYEYAIPWYGERRPILIDLIGNENIDYRTEYDFIREDGETLKAEVFVPSVYGGKGAYLWVTASPLLDNKGKQYGAIESVRDITERKQAEFALQRSEERFRAVAESAVDLIITTDVNGTVLFCNKSLETIFGYSREEIIGKNLTVLMPERLKKDYIDGLEDFKFSGEHVRVGKTLKTIGLRKDGIEFPFEMSLASWKSGEKNFFTAIIRDITESEKAKKQLMKSLIEKEILLKEIHHRVKNNLQIISSLLDLQETYVKEDETAVNVLMESQNRVLSMAMIHEMLYQSKDLSHINFSDYLRSLVSSLFHTYGVESRINVVVNVENCFLNVETSVPLGLIISELLSNSLKYAFPDNMTGELVVSIKNEDSTFELIISDDGVGFPEDIDFRNVDSSLGLQLVNSLVNQLDGTIELDRSVGTKFVIKFKELKYLERV